MSIFRGIALTLAYVTCLKLPGWNYENESLKGLAKYLPVAGLVIGVCLLTVNAALSWPHTQVVFRACILAIAWLVLTNGIHFDGLMDTADGIFSHQTPERALAIMQDPRVGNFGVLAGVSVLILKLASLSALDPLQIMLAIFFIPQWSRWTETVAISSFPYLKKEGKGKIWHDSAKHPRDIFLAGLVPAICVAAACAFGYWQAATFSAFTIASGLVAATWLANKLGGHTGDTYGCVVEVAEAGALVCSALVAMA
jgi:adenosylcobinamide-GDP ribazoletransferase